VKGRERIRAASQIWQDQPTLSGRGPDPYLQGRRHSRLRPLAAFDHLPPANPLRRDQEVGPTAPACPFEDRKPGNSKVPAMLPHAAL